MKVVWKLEDPAVLARERQQREQEQVCAGGDRLEPKPLRQTFFLPRKSDVVDLCCTPLSCCITTQHVDNYLRYFHETLSVTPPPKKNGSFVLYRRLQTECFCAQPALLIYEQLQTMLRAILPTLLALVRNSFWVST